MSGCDTGCAVHVMGVGVLTCSGIDPALALQEGDSVIVEIGDRLDNGIIKDPLYITVDDKTAGFVRKAKSADLRQIRANESAARQALARIAEAAREEDLYFKPLQACYSFKRETLSILFGGDSNTNLKGLFALVPDDIDARVELRQVGIRDECAMLGGIGPCGRPYCCCTWQTHFNHVNIRMAKVQEMPLTPATVNGGCERLKCCLRFEYDNYCEAAKGLPFYGATVEGEGVRGEVVGRDVLRGLLTIRTTENRYVRLPYAELRIARKDSSER